jgi:nicotinamidase/pyrazinamidase
MIRILDIVDMQGDFMRTTGKLYVPNSDILVSRTNVFFEKIQPGFFDAALFKYDTHFADEYNHSPEKEFFPLHCEYGTEGWNLVVDPSLLAGKTKIRYMAKNTFDMWDRNPLPRDKELVFKTDDEKLAYANLHRISGNPRVTEQGILRDEFMATTSEKGLKGVKVTLIGVASDFCDDDAMLGYLANGASVEVVEDLVAGIGTEVPGRSRTGHIRDVITLDRFKPYVDSGKLTLTTVEKVFKSMQP